MIGLHHIEMLFSCNVFYIFLLVVSGVLRLPEVASGNLTSFVNFYALGVLQFMSFIN